jgi:predicted ATPase
MLREIHLSSFKCFDNLDLPLGPLTLLTGVNGGGKSSVMQALVLLSQTFGQQEWARALLLEGPELALGNVADVLNQSSARRSLALGITSDQQTVKWTFKAEDRQALSIELEQIEIDGQQISLGNATRWLMPPDYAEASSVVSALRHLSWITAERTGPRELMPLRVADGHARVGHHGEMAAGLLYWRGEDEVNPTLCLPDTPPTLFHQVRGHMQRFFPGCDLRVSPIDGVSAISLRLRSNSRSDFQRPQNVGFGLTQLFPIIVSLLAARTGDVLLIENPEVHLHPRAQQEIGMLLTETAASGVQVVLETHSDHVLNGVRLAVKQKKLPAADVRVHFFTHRSGDQTVIPESPVMDEDGRLDSWPEGFFDQFDFALAELM